MKNIQDNQTEKTMELELKHIVPYLSYRLKVKTDRLGTFEIDGYRTIKNGGISIKTNDTHIGFIEEMKPILRPLTEFGDSDDTRRVHEFIGLGKWCDNYDEYFRVWFDDLSNIDRLIFQAPQEIFNYFLAQHFDVFGLIQKGLAISIHDIQTT